MAPRYPIASRQPYTGQPVDHSPILTNAQLPYVGQLGPAAAETIASTHGRQLAGFGDSVVPSDDDPAHFNDEPDWHDQSMRAMEDEDDVVGSGVFDAEGRTTVHDDMGVFRDHPSVPGFIARNPPYRLNHEVRDVVNGGPTVEVSGGGLFYVERDGRLADLPTTRMSGGYVELTQQGTAPVGWSRPSTVYPSMPLVPQQSTTRGYPFSEQLVPARSTVNVANVSRPIAGFGDEEQPPEKAGWGSWLVAGLIVGTAGAIAWGTLKKV